MDNRKETIETLAELYCASYYTEGFETVLEASEGIGKGWGRLFELRSGFELMISSMEQRQNLIANIEEKGSQLTISFCLSGKMRGSFRDQKSDFIVGHGQNILCFTPRSMCTSEFPSGQTYDYVNIRIEPRVLNGLMEGQFDQIPADIHSIIDESNKNYYSHIGSMTSSMHMVIHQILNCPYLGFIKRMYLESKAMELIAHQLAQLVFTENCLQKPSVLRCDDIERIHYARDLLVKDIQKPPTIYKLSRMVGINEFKLKKGFRQLYDTSIHRYLLDLRFEHARYLLEQGNMNVSEVAYSVGYSTLGHFYAAFKKRFGVTPGAYCRDVRKAINP
jgi:AraC-like DNA-binding protein